MIFKTREEALKALKVIAASVVDAYVQATEIAMEHDINTAVFEKFIRDAQNKAILNKIQEKVDEIRKSAEIEGIETYDDWGSGGHTYEDFEEEEG